MRQYQHLMVIAHKESATAMLDLEDGGQHIDSMILVDPKLRKLRLQTPSVLFTHATLEHIDALRGTVRVVHAGDSDLAIVKQILEAATELRKEERPIRFSTRF
jgi:Fe-S cluster assembly ATPase SufC